MAEKIGLFVGGLYVILRAAACFGADSGDAAGKSPFFLDYAASYPISEDALEEFTKVNRLGGNSSGINPHAERLRKIEKRAAEIIGEKIGVKNPDLIRFTCSATLANNIAILGAAGGQRGCHLITSKIEHKSVLKVFKHLETQGCRVTYLSPDRYGRIDPSEVEKNIRENTKLISIQMFNSEIGTLQDISAIGKIARRHKILFHTDAAQSFGRYDIDAEKMNIDLLTLSGHKIGAPKGIAVLYVRNADRLQPILFGSGDILFPGTKPTPLIAALAVAVQKFRYDKTKIIENFTALRSELLKIGDVYVNSVSPSHVLSISVGGVLLKDVLERVKDYSLSSGCSCTGEERSNVIEAIDPENKLPSCTLRISFSDTTQVARIVDFAQKLKTAVTELRKERSVGTGCESAPDKSSQKKLNDTLEKIRRIAVS
jgi:cysteine desulfurase